VELLFPSIDFLPLLSLRFLSNITQCSTTTSPPFSLSNEECSDDGVEGGCFFCSLRSSDLFSVNDSTLSGNSCPNGRGGCAFCDCRYPGSLGLMFSEISLSDNSACFGCDLFIVCEDIKTQIVYSMFLFNLRSINNKTSIWGFDSVDSTPQNLFDSLAFNQNDTIVVNVNGTDEPLCGSNAFPCRSISEGAKHVQSMDFEKRLFVDVEGLIGKETSVKDVVVKAQSKTASLQFDSLIEDVSDFLFWECFDRTY